MTRKKGCGSFPESLHQLMYAVVCTSFGKPEFYEGMWYRRGDGIKEHSKAKEKSWKQCLADGDVCVRVMVEVSR